MLNSLWAGQALPTFPPLTQDLRTRVLIVGGGLAGLLCAYQLHQEGVDYALIEADTICHGISRNTTAKITSQHGLLYHKLLRRFDAYTARRYWEIHEAALSRYRTLAQTIDCGLESADNYIYSRKDPKSLTREINALRQLGIPAEYVQTPELPFPTAGAIRFPDQAKFHPLRFAAAIAHGLHIYEHTPAREFLGDCVTTDGGRITADKIILATHFPILNKHGGYFLKLYQQRSYVLALENAPLPEGMYLSEEADGLSLRSYQNLLLLGGGGHRTGKPSPGWVPLENFAAEYFPTAKPVCRWAAQDCISLDGLPYIGQYSRQTPNLFTATGFNKWGMTSAMVSAMILSDLVQDRTNRYADLFSPLRSCLRPRLLANGLEATVNLLTPTRPRCPHLGCALKWNPQEHSWDCPCHGSRFDASGTLLDNPATGNLDLPK